MKSKKEPAASPALRLLGKVLIRGPEASHIRADLDELFARDITRGVSRTRAHARYARNMLPSAVATWRAPRMSRSFMPSMLDFRLGLRMLAKYPGLTVVGGLAIAFAICVGAAAFEVLTQALQPSLPLPAGDRIVGIRQWDAASGDVEARVLDDLERWRRSLRSVEDLGAFRTLEQNLVANGAAGPPVAVAELSASAFRVAGVNPLLGRALLEADEQAGAAPVIVIGHDVWQTRFGGSADAVGANVSVDGEDMTVVGVMPEGFAFPIAHEMWRPLRAAAYGAAPRDGPAVHVFGRLARGATLERAQSELSVLGEAAAAEYPDTHEHLRPQVMPYARSVLNLSLGVSGELDLAAIAFLVRTTANIPLILFLVLVCGNVALLIFARAATREREIALRNALGASRSRIIVQLFAEALVLGSVAMVLGLAAADFTLRWGVNAVQGALLNGTSLPFWFEPALSRSTILYAAALTLLVAVIAGVLPALKVTRGLGERLQRASAGAGGFRFGGVWTAVIVAQIAVTLPFPITVLAVRDEANAIRALKLDFPEEQYLAVRLGYDHGAAGSGVDTSRAAAAARLQANLNELERRLVAEPGINGVTFANRLPRMYHPYYLIEMDEGGAAPLDPRWPAYRVSTASVAPDFFDVLQVPVLAGRGFRTDETSEDGVVIVNESFVRRVLGGRNAIGRRLRFTAFDESGPLPKDVIQPWHEIVGVVPDLGMSYGDDPKEAGIYHPAAPGSTYLMAVHISGAVGEATSRLRDVAASVDPALRLHEPGPITEFTRTELRFYSFWEWFLTAASGVALVLALAGIYSVMSFTVAQRTREIGIRVTLGADPRRVVSAIFRRPLRQVGAGIALGTLILVVPLAVEGEFLTLRITAILLAYVAAMTAILMLAWILPTRRALSVEPTEALRWE